MKKQQCTVCIKTERVLIDVNVLWEVLMRKIEAQYIYDIYYPINLYLLTYQSCKNYALHIATLRHCMSPSGYSQNM